MGCGTSKAAQVHEKDITIKDYPTTSSPHHHPHTQTNEIPNDCHNDTNDENNQINPEISDQSAIERAVRDLTISETSEDQPVGANEQGPLSSTDSLQRPVVFEVCMISDGTKSPRKAPPRLLAKMESTSKITNEQLAKKQKLVEERKQKELSKRANSRISRRERLRKEVMAAREMEDSDRLQTEDPNKHKQKEEYSIENKLVKTKHEPSDCFQGSYDASAEIEVDSTYNTDHEQQLGMWDDTDMQEQMRRKDEQNIDDNLFFDDQPLTNSLEQYM